MHLKPLPRAKYAKLSDAKKVAYLEDQLAVANTRISFLTQDGGLTAELAAAKDKLASVLIENKVLGKLIDRVIPERIRSEF